MAHLHHLQGGWPGGPPYDWAKDRRTAWSPDTEARERHPTNRLRRRRRPDNHGDHHHDTSTRTTPP